LELEKKRKALRRAQALEKPGKQPKAVRKLTSKERLLVKKELIKLKKIFPESFSDDLIKSLLKIEKE